MLNGFKTCNHTNNDDTLLNVSDTDISKMNKDQRFAFKIVMKTIQNHIETPKYLKPLRTIVSGTAGSANFFVIKCLVKAIVQISSPVLLYTVSKVSTRKRGKEMKHPSWFVG